MSAHEHKKVLIVDPSPIFRRTLKEVIETSEPQVRIQEADSAARARPFCEMNRLMLFFSTLRSLGPTASAFIETIKGMVPDIRIVVLTNHDSAEHKEAALQKGANYFLSKERSGGLRLLDVIHATICQQGECLMP